jgi:hypothetical protein
LVVSSAVEAITSVVADDGATGTVLGSVPSARPMSVTFFSARARAMRRAVARLPFGLRQ